MDHEARAGAAALALVEEDGAGGSGDGFVEIGVGEDDGRALAAELEGDFLEVSGGGVDDEAADFGRSGEGDLVDEGMCGERGSGAFAEAGEDVDDAFGEAGFVDEFGEAEAGHRGLLGELEDDGAAGGERGAELPGGHEQREVPGDDLGGDADGFAQGVGVEVAGERERERVAGDFGGPSGHVAEHVDGERHVGGAGDGDGLAVVERLEFGEFVEVLFEQVAELPDEAAALGGLHAGPGAVVEGVAGGADGAVDVFRLGLGNVGHDLAGGGIVDGEGLAGGGEDEASVDEHAVFLGDEVVGVAADAGIDGESGHVNLRRTVAGSAGKRGFCASFGRAWVVRAAKHDSIGVAGLASERFHSGNLLRVPI